MKITKKHYLISVCFVISFFYSSCIMNVKAEPYYPILEKSKNPDIENGINLLEQAMHYYFSKDYAVMHRFYNPFTQVHSDEKASVWMYTSAIEAVNSILKSLHHQSQRDMPVINKYEKLLETLYENADYYLGTFELISFTQTNTWSIYAVDRVKEKGKARVTGIYNVYDDQMWLVRELLESYHLTKNSKYLQKAEYLTEYVLDGWDPTRDANGQEHGGIPWGPGYVTKHACSNGPMISPLVWLHEIYKHKKDEITHRFIDPKDQKSRKSKSVYKKDYYMDFAKKIYDWQKKYLLNNRGLYTDMMGDCDPNCDVAYEEVSGKRYRAHTRLLKPIGREYSYNSGTMLSGAIELYKVTKTKKYLEDAKKLAQSSFQYFAHKDKQLPNYYTFPTDGFNNWFNTVLLRAYVDYLPFDKSASTYIEAYSKNLNYGYNTHNKNGLLPVDLLAGWNLDENKNDVEGMFMFSYVSQFALFEQYNHLKNK